ncbi:MAG TPA: ankyrin repeat domain-containing protein [Anaerolineaceae bacterium]
MDAFQELIETIQAGNDREVRRQVHADPGLLVRRTPEGLSPLMVALYHGQTDLVKFIISQGIPLGIFEAAATGKSLRVLEIIKAQPELANTFSPDGFTPLALAAFFGHQTVTEYLLARGADASIPASNSSQVQPLHSAVAGRHLAITQILLQAGADPNARQQGGLTPLHAAAQNEQLEMVRLLLEHGADPLLKSDEGKLAADYALESGNQRVVALLNPQV